MKNDNFPSLNVLPWAVKALKSLSLFLSQSTAAHCFVKLLGVYLQDENVLTLSSSNSIIQINFPIKLFSFLGGGVQKREKSVLSNEINR